MLGVACPERERRAFFEEKFPFNLHHRCQKMLMGKWRTVFHGLVIPCAGQAIIV